jgi:hypothetical protein
MEDWRARIRMYKQGLGDCFLITLPKTDGSQYHILIDCGVILGTPDVQQIMTRVVENIVETTNGKVDLLLATHEHWDHLSGFLQAKDSFKKLKVEQVWLGWTENLDDSEAKKLHEARHSTLNLLHKGVGSLHLAGEDDAAAQIGGLLDFFGVVGRATTKDALEAVRKMVDVPRYCKPQDDPITLADTEVRLYILGPPTDEAMLRKTDDSKRNPETYNLALEALHNNMTIALPDGEELEGIPFSALYRIPSLVANQMEFFQKHYTSSEQWRQIENIWLNDATELALDLDNKTNNTSLVLAIELANGDVLLFASDAQVGNWLSWQGLKWNIGGREVTGPELLERTIFYKVGHHGSHNATLREKGLEMMKNLHHAMIPVDQDMAKKKRWVRMPLYELVEALENKTQGRGGVIRSDQPASPAEFYVDLHL